MIISEAEFRCPMCNKKFNFIIRTAYSIFGSFLDLKPRGSGIEPFPVPKYPDCNFVFKDGMFSDEDINILRKKLKINRIFEFETNMPDYYYLAKECELVDKDIEEITYYYQSALWESSNDDLCNKISDIILKNIEMIDSTDDEYSKYKIIKLDLLRRNGNFEMAEEVIKELYLDKYFLSFKANLTLLEYQQELIDKGDVDEHIWPPNKEDVEKEKRFNHFVCTTTISIKILNNSTDKEILDVLYKITLLNRSYLYQKIKNNFPILVRLIERTNSRDYFELLSIIAKIKKSNIDAILIINNSNIDKEVNLKDISTKDLYSKHFQIFIYELFNSKYEKKGG